MFRREHSRNEQLAQEIDHILLIYLLLVVWMMHKNMPWPVKVPTQMQEAPIVSCLISSRAVVVSLPVILPVGSWLLHQWTSSMTPHRM